MAKTVPTIGPVIQDVWVDEARDGHSHHVRVVEGDPNLRACVEHLVTDCFTCGRTPGNHALWDEERSRMGDDNPRLMLDCQGYVARPKCGCGLPKGDRLP